MSPVTTGASARHDVATRSVAGENPFTPGAAKTCDTPKTPCTPTAPETHTPTATARDAMQRLTVRPRSSGGYGSRPVSRASSESTLSSVLARRDDVAATTSLASMGSTASRAVHPVLSYQIERGEGPASPALVCLGLLLTRPSAVLLSPFPFPPLLHCYLLCSHLFSSSPL
jgi:hypothetical protein